MREPLGSCINLTHARLSDGFLRLNCRNWHKRRAASSVRSLGGIASSALPHPTSGQFIPEGGNGMWAKRRPKVILDIEAGQTGLSTRKLILESFGYNVLAAA